MKRSLPADPPPSLIAFELEPGKVLFIHPLAAPQVEGLPAAEAEVLTLVLDGHDTAAIAKIHGTSTRTAANQVASIFKRLRVRSRAELAAKLAGGPT